MRYFVLKVAGPDFGASGIEFEITEDNPFQDPFSMAVEQGLCWNGEIPKHRWYNKRGVKTDFVGDKGYPCIRKTALEKLLSRFALHDLCQLIDTGLSPYVGVNLLGSCDCLDREASEIRYLSNGEINYVFDIHLDVPRIDGSDLFRLPEQNGILIASEDFADYIRSERMTGVAFSSLVDWMGDYQMTAVSGLPLV